jgi:glycosyltransferase involved in cell wall biosynthesis
MKDRAASQPARGLRVALVHYAAPPVVGGVERVLAQHAVLLADAGHDVRIVAGTGEAPDPRVAMVQVPLLDPRHAVVERQRSDLDAGHVPEDFATVVAALRSSLESALAGVDVLIAHNVASLGLNLAATAALREIAETGAPSRVILWHHDLAWASVQYRSTLHDGYPWNLLRRSWPGVLHVAVSEIRRAQLATLMGIAPDSITVVPDGIDVAGTMKLEPRSADLLARIDRMGLDPVLLVPARVTPRKNIEGALEVVAAMRSMGRAAGLLVTGPVDPHREAGHDYLARLLTLRSRLSLDDVAWFLATEPSGVPSDAVVNDLYRLSDVLFMPSRDEGFGLPILEAAVHRLPIVCADLPPLRDLAGEAALYVGPDDDPTVSAKRILAHIEANRSTRLARRVRSEYSWDAVYRRGIAPLLRRGPGPP